MSPLVIDINCLLACRKAITRCNAMAYAADPEKKSPSGIRFRLFRYPLNDFLQRLFRILSDSIRFPRKTMTAKAELTSPQRFGFLRFGFLRFGFLRFGFLRFSRCKIWSSAGSHPTTLVQLQLRLHSLNVLTGSSINANDIPFINKRWSNKFGARFDLYRFGNVCRCVPLGPWLTIFNRQFNLIWR